MGEGEGGGEEGDERWEEERGVHCVVRGEEGRRGFVEGRRWFANLRLVRAPFKRDGIVFVFLGREVCNCLSENRPRRDFGGIRRLMVRLVVVDVGFTLNTKPLPILHFWTGAGRQNPVSVSALSHEITCDL